MSSRWGAGWVALALLAACGEDEGMRDAGGPVDGRDAEPIDAEGADAGLLDGGFTDGGSSDGGPIDANVGLPLRIEIEGDGAGHVRSEPAGLDCALPCASRFPAGATVTLTIEPAYRSTLDGIDADGCEAGVCTLTLDAPRTLTARLDHHQAMRLSETDRDPRMRIRADGLAADFYIHGGGRSVQSIAPGSGVFYFEARPLIDDLLAFGFGVATASAPLLDTFAGATDQSFGVTFDGSLYYDDVWLTRVAASPTYGLVVDYRGASPVVHVIARPESDAELVYTRSLEGITAPIHVFVAGSKRAPGFHLEINAGSDTTNMPFALDPRAALRASGLDEVADALVLGWGDTYAGAPDALPVLTVSPDRVVSAGTPVTVSATALDAEDGDVGAQIQWELLSTPHYAGRLRGEGPTFTFTPTAVGLHPARAWLRDRVGRTVEAIVRVRVEGPVAQRSSVRLMADSLSGEGVELSADGLAARWTRSGKRGVRANQSLYGEWGYFEIQRLTEPVNQGGGLVVGDGNIDPYTWDDVPGSCSINNLGGVWRDLVWECNFPLEAASYDTYGFAVDYRGEHPIVYVILAGEVIAELVLDDVWVELYPMLYGDPTGITGPGEYDEAINFGGAPFAHDASAALAAYGVDVTGFVPGWGHVHTAD